MHHGLFLNRCEQGYVLVIAMMTLLVLTMLGILATKSTMTELMISGNDRVHKQTFYQADGGSELAERLIYHNAICTATNGGFASDTLGTSITIEDLTLSANETTADLFTTISDSNRTAAYYPDGTIDDSEPHTNFLNTVAVTYTSGSGTSMVSGYDGTGSSSVTATRRIYTIASQHFGKVNSESIIQVKWDIENTILSSASSYDCEY
jgi:Tfp pilus assembly protein PilX